MNMSGLSAAATGGTTPPPPDPTCDDIEQNGDEEGIDCGGSCPESCVTDPDPVGSQKYKFGGLLRSVSNELP